MTQRAARPASPLWPDSTLLLASGGCLLLGSSAFNFDMPLNMKQGGYFSPAPMAYAAEHGDALHQIALVAFALIGLALLRRRLPAWPRPAGWFGAVALALLAWNCLSYVWADTPGIVGRRIGVLLLAALGGLGLSCLGDRQFRVLLTVLLLQLVLIGLGNEILLGTFQPFATGYRFAGVFHPNFQAWNDAILFLLALSFVPERDIPGVFKYTLLGGSLFFLLLTNSRTSLICLMVAAGFWFGVRSAAVGSAAIRTALIGAGLLMSVAVLLQGAGLVAVADIAQAVFGTQRDEGDIGSLTGRVDLWAVCLRFAAVHWVLGYGYDGFWTPDRILQVSEEARWGLSEAHSAYIEALLSSGLVGLALYVATLGLGVAAATRRFRQTRSETALMAGAVLVFCIVHGITESIAVTPVMTGGIVPMMLTAKLAFARPGGGAG